jgi:hypothetical protein
MKPRGFALLGLHWQLRLQATNATTDLDGLALDNPCCRETSLLGAFVYVVRHWTRSYRYEGAC